MSTQISERAAAGSNVAWQLVERLDEHRSHPRIDMQCDVEFRNAAGQHCVARLLNLAPDGIQVRCNVATAQVLHPCGGKICADDAPIVQAEINLSLPRGETALSVCARLMYLKTVPEEPRCVMGLHFLDLRPTASRILDEFFSAEMQAFFQDEEALLLSAAV